MNRHHSANSGSLKWSFPCLPLAFLCHFLYNKTAITYIFHTLLLVIQEWGRKQRWDCHECWGSCFCLSNCSFLRSLSLVTAYEFMFNSSIPVRNSMIWGWRGVSNKHERGIAKLLWFEGTSGDDVVQPLNKRATLLVKTASACLSYTVGFWFTV